MPKIKFNISLRELLHVSRPFSWPNTAVPFVAGYLLATSRLDLSFWLGAVYFLFSYNLAMYGVNDIYDYESDIKNPRKDSIEGSILPRSKHAALWLWVALLNVPFLAYFLVTGDTVSRIAILVVAFLCLSYSVKGLRFKEIPFLDSINSACHFVGPFVFALLYGKADQPYWPIIASFMLWGIASQAFGAIQDIVPDRSANIRSIATYLGTKRTASFVFACYVLSAVITALCYPPFGLVVAALLAIYALNIAFFRKYRSDAQSYRYHRGWQNFLWLNPLVGFWLTQLVLFVADPFKLGSQRYAIVAMALVGLGLAQLALTLYNLVLLRRPVLKRPHEWPKVSVILHAYNQADNISSTLLAILGQNYPDFEVLFADLGSDDNTLKLASGFQDERLRIVELEPLENDWHIGSWAANQLTQLAEGTVVVSLAADTILMPNALSTLVSHMDAQKLQLISLLPADQNKTLAQKFILNQNHFLLLGVYPAAYLEHHHPDINLSYSGLVGFEKSAISSIHGFELVKRSPIEDLELAKQASLHGLKTAFYLASDMAVSQNHADLGMILKQNAQRFYPSLHFNMPLTTAAISLGSFLFITPGAGVLISAIYAPHMLAIWLAAYIAGLLPRAVVAITSKQGLLGTLLYPATSIITLATLFYSMLNYELLKPRWEERTELSLD